MPTPAPVRSVRFEIDLWDEGNGPVRELVPFVDGVSLVDLVSTFERAAGYHSAGAYAGLVLDNFNFGDLSAYLTGRPTTASWASQETIALLGCACGEVGCWPLEAEVLLEHDSVVWRGFGQPYRPERDYGDFGPFVFRRQQYESAVRDAVAGM